MLALAFLACQCVAIACSVNGPFLDEAVNATVGLQLLRGRPGDFGWLGGSVYAYPVLVGAAYAAGGLAGARLVTALLYTLALWLFSRFSSRLVGPTASLFATGLLAVNGIWFSIAHLAVYDALAMAALCGAAWAAVEMARTQRLRWALAAGLWSALAVIAKYPTVIALLPVAGLAFTASRRRPSLQLIAASLGIATIAVTAYMLLAHGFLIPRVALTQAVGEPSIFDQSTLAYQAAYTLALPLALAIPGALRVFRKRPALVIVLVAGSLIWPILHVVMERYQSLSKDSAFGFIELYPLAGVSVSELWRERRRVVAGVLGVAISWGFAQCYWQDRSWGDIRPVVAFIVPELQPTDRVALEHGWAFSMYAVLAGRLPSPAAVIDRYRYEHGEDVCDAQWIIGTRHSPLDTSDPLVRAAESCQFKLVRSFPYEFYSPVPPLVRHLEWEYQVYRR